MMKALRITVVQRTDVQRGLRPFHVKQHIRPPQHHLYMNRLENGPLANYCVAFYHRDVVDCCPLTSITGLRPRRNAVVSEDHFEDGHDIARVDGYWDLAMTAAVEKSMDGFGRRCRGR